MTESTSYPFLHSWLTSATPGLTFPSRALGSWGSDEHFKVTWTDLYVQAPFSSPILSIQALGTLILGDQLTPQTCVRKPNRASLGTCSFSAARGPP